MKAAYVLPVLLSVLFSAGQAFAQTLIYDIKIFDKDRKPLSDKRVWLKETSSGRILEEQTGSDGVAHFEITTGKQWSINVEELENIGKIDMPESGTMNAQRSFPYVPAMYKRLSDKPDRTGISFKEIDQTSYKRVPVYGKGQAVVIIAVKTPKGKLLTGLDVAMVNMNTKTKYTNKTNYDGKAYFLVPGGPKYYIDVDGTENFQTERTDNFPRGYESTLTLTYSPTRINFETRNDTIIQKIKPDQRKTTGHSLAKITVQKEGKPAKNELVWMENLSDAKVYETRTNNNGIATFLIPLGGDYMVSFEFEPDVDVIRLNNKYSTTGTLFATLIYKPIPRLANPEQFIPQPEEIFLKTFSNFVDEQWPKPENNRSVDVFLKWGNNLINGQSKEAVLEMRIVAPDEEPQWPKGAARSKDSKPKNINLCLVLDVSGSMAGNERLPALKTAVKGIIDQMSAKDKISIISFESNPKVLLSTQFVTNKPDLFEKVDLLYAGGGTNIYEGLKLGYEETLQNRSSDHPNRMILVTDGYGSRTPDEVVSLAKTIVDDQTPISTIGVGEYYNFSLLTLIAELSGEQTAQVFQSDDMSTTFENQMASYVSPLATDFKLELVYNNKVNLQKIFGSAYVQNDPIAVMEIPVVYKSMKKIGIALFDLKKANKDIEKAPVIMKFSYTNALGQKESYEKTAVLKWSNETGSFELIHDAEEKKLYAIAIMNQSIKVMADNFAQDKYKEALFAVEDCMRQIEELYPNAKTEHVRTLHNELKNYSKALRQKMRNERR